MYFYTDRKFCLYLSKEFIFIQNKQQYLVKIENTTQFIHVYLICFMFVYVYVHETTNRTKKKEEEEN